MSSINRRVKEDGVRYRNMNDGTYMRTEYKDGDIVGRMSILTEEEYQNEVNKDTEIENDNSASKEEPTIETLEKMNILIPTKVQLLL